MKKKAQRSKRNRHTGRVNAFKQNILDRGESCFGGTHKRLAIGHSQKIGHLYTVVRIPV